MCFRCGGQLDPVLRRHGHDRHPLCERGPITPAATAAGLAALAATFPTAVVIEEEP